MEREPPERIEKEGNMDAKILVVDDEKAILDLLGQFFLRYEYDVDLVEELGKALELIEKNRYDIILTDKNMPDPDGTKEGGMSLLRYTKEHCPSTDVIMITGFATIETAVEAMKLGAFDYVMKPIHLATLKEKIDRILEYRSFINSENTLQVYRTLHNQLLNHLENRNDLPEEQLNRIIKTLGARIDGVFGVQKEYEKIIQTQADTLKRIEGYMSPLKDVFPPDSPYSELVEKICLEAKKRV